MCLYSKLIYSCDVSNLSIERHFTKPLKFQCIVHPLSITPPSSQAFNDQSFSEFFPNTTADTKQAFPPNISFPEKTPPPN